MIQTKLKRVNWISNTINSERTRVPRLSGMYPNTFHIGLYLAFIETYVCLDEKICYHRQHLCSFSIPKNNSHLANHTVDRQQRRSINKRRQEDIYVDI